MGQVFNGLTTGAVGYASQVYAGECVMVNHVRLRNSFLMWNGVGGSLGSTATLLMATFINYRQICTVCTLLSITLLVLLCKVIPESPAWLYHKGRIGDAEWSAKKLGIAQPILSQDPKIAPLVRQPSEVSWSSLKSEASKFRRRDVYKPILIFVGVNVLLATCGATTLLTYMINIIQNDVPGSTASSGDKSVIVSELANSRIQYVPFYAWHQSPQYSGYSHPHPPPVDPLSPSMAHPPEVDPLISFVVQNETTIGDASSTTSSTPTYVPTDANMYSVIIGILMCMTSLTSCLILPYFGIRNILTTSEACASFAFVILAFTTIYDSTPDVLKWRVMAISMIAVMYSLSSGSSDAVLGDVLPADAKGFASLVSVCSFFAVALTNKSFPHMYAMMGGHVFLLFSIICILAVYFIRSFMPEVLGKTLDQINREFLKV